MDGVVAVKVIWWMFLAEVVKEVDVGYGAYGGVGGVCISRDRIWKKRLF